MIFGIIAGCIISLIIGLAIGSCSDEIKEVFVKFGWQRLLNVFIIFILLLAFYYKVIYKVDEIFVANLEGEITRVTAFDDGTKWATVHFGGDWYDLTIKNYTGPLKSGNKVNVKITEER